MMIPNDSNPLFPQACHYILTHWCKTITIDMNNESYIPNYQQSIGRSIELRQRITKLLTLSWENHVIYKLVLSHVPIFVLRRKRWRRKNLILRQGSSFSICMTISWFNKESMIFPRPFYFIITDRKKKAPSYIWFCPQ